MGIKRKRACDDTLSGATIISSDKVDPNTALLQHSDSSNLDTPFNNTLLPWPVVHTFESISSSESSQASSQRFPLTKRNLHQFNRSMASNPNTPDNKSRKTKETTTSSSQNARSVRDALDANNIYIGKRNAKARGMDLIEKAKAIVKGDRKSALK